MFKDCDYVPFLHWMASCWMLRFGYLGMLGSVGGRKFTALHWIGGVNGS